MEKEFTISKSTVESYKIRFPKNHTWADISVDPGEKSGRIQIASDYGDWQYYWGSCGSQFKEFLIDLNIGYAACKFGEDKFFDLNSTIESLRNRIMDYAGPEDKDALAGLLHELDELKNSSCKEEFVHKIQNCDAIMEMENYSPDLCFTINPLFKIFWEGLWKVFVDELKNEIKS